MNNNLIAIALVGLVLLNIVDSDFVNPTAIDYLKFVLLAIALILSLRKR
jgi:hypothetical protein